MATFYLKLLTWIEAMNIESIPDIELLKLHFLGDTPDNILLETETEIIRRWAGRLPVVFVQIPFIAENRRDYTLQKEDAV